MTGIIHPTRRAALTGAAGAAALATLGAPRLAAAGVPLQGPARPEIYRFQLGQFEVTTILDGAIQLDGPHPIFGQNTTAEDVQALAAANFLPTARMEIGFTQTLLNTGSELILFDGGNGAGRRPAAGRLLELLASAGVQGSDIDVVVLTHFHGDHIGGLTEDGSPAFPNARYVIPQAEYDFWTADGLASQDGMEGRVAQVPEKVVPFAEKATFIGDGASVLSCVTAVASSGHTPGHTSYHIESDGKRLLVLGDVCNHFVVSLQRPDWHVRFDMDKEAAVAARKKTLGMVAAEKIPFIGYHMPYPSIGYLEPLGEGFRFVAASYQLNV